MPAPLGEVLDFMRILWALDHGLQLTSKRMVTTWGLTGPQRMVIRLVGRFPNISAGHLAQALHLHPSTLTGVLKRLEAREILWRKPDPKDGRRALFGLTPKGRELNIPMRGTVESAIEAALAKLPADTVKAAGDALAEIARQLTDGLQTPRERSSTA